MALCDVLVLAVMSTNVGFGRPLGRAREVLVIAGWRHTGTRGMGPVHQASQEHDASPRLDSR